MFALLFNSFCGCSRALHTLKGMNHTVRTLINISTIVYLALRASPFSNLPNSLHLPLTAMKTGVLLLSACIVLMCDAFRMRSFAGLQRHRQICQKKATETAPDVQGTTAFQQVKRSKKKPTWEEKYENDPLRSDMPTEDLLPPVDPFTHWFVSFATVDKMDRRRDAWLQHIQWARRSILAQSLLGDLDAVVEESERSVIPSVKVENSYTLLHDDCMGPKAQVLVIRANHSDAVLDYLHSEPLAAHKAIMPWQVFELHPEESSHHKDEDEDWRDYLCGDLSDPYMLLAMNSNTEKAKSAQKGGLKSGGKVDAKSCEAMLDQSLGYHLHSAGAPYVPPQLLQTATKERNAAPSQVVKAAEGTPPRVVMLGRLRPVGRRSSKRSSGTTSAGNTDTVTGQLLLFNAKTRADALRYLANDPVAQSTQSGATGSAQLFDTMMLSAVNVQDVSGLHHLMPRTFGAKTQLDQIHYLDPEDLLQHAEEEGLIAIPTLPQHFAENHRLLEVMERHGVSHRYTRMDESELLRASRVYEDGGQGMDGAHSDDGGTGDAGDDDISQEVGEEDLEEGWGTADDSEE